MNSPLFVQRGLIEYSAFFIAINPPVLRFFPPIYISHPIWYAHYVLVKFRTLGCIMDRLRIDGKLKRVVSQNIIDDLLNRDKFSFDRAPAKTK